MNGLGTLDTSSGCGVGGEATSCLVVDDHPALCRGLAAALANEEDLEVVGQAGDAREALRLAARRRPAVVVLDIQMPGMDGLECCAEMRAVEGPPEVVLYTAFDDPSLLDAGLEAGATGFVLKSAPTGDVVRAVRAVAAGRPFVDAELTSALLQRRDREGSPLSAREAEVLQLLANGKTTDAVGQELFLSPATIRSYAESAMGKLESRNRVHAIATAIRRRLID